MEGVFLQKLLLAFDKNYLIIYTVISICHKQLGGFFMKVCLSSSGNDLSSSLDLRFGRCQYFIIVNTENDEVNAISNDANLNAHGAGISSAQSMIDLCVDVVITGNVGPNAMRILENSSIKVYRGFNDTLENNLQALENNKLEIIDQAGPSHSGLGNKNKLGRNS